MSCVLRELVFPLHSCRQRWWLVLNLFLGARQLARLRPFLDEGALAARGIGHAMNLGMYDFFPSLAGKGPVVRFLQAKWGLKQSECIALFDDDNDIKMVHEVMLAGGPFEP